VRAETLPAAVPSVHATLHVAASLRPS